MVTPANKLELKDIGSELKRLLQSKMPNADIVKVDIEEAELLGDGSVELRVRVVFRANGRLDQAAKIDALDEFRGFLIERDYIRFPVVSFVAEAELNNGRSQAR